MNYKKWLYSGIIIFVASLTIGFLGVFWFINNSFNALKTNETAGIGAVGNAIENAIYFNIFAIIGKLTGIIFIVIGGIKAYKQNKSQN